MLDVLHSIRTRLRACHLRVRVGDSSRRSEDIVKKKSRIAPFTAIIIITVVIVSVLLPLWKSGTDLLGKSYALPTETEGREQTCSLNQLQSTDIGEASPCTNDPLVGLVVKASASRTEDPGFEFRLRQDFSGVESYYSDLKIGTPVATLLGAWRYRVSAGTGWPGVSILWLGEMEGLICNFYLSVAARKIVWADPSLRYTRMLLEREAINKQILH